MARIRLSRGKRANLPTLYDGEPAYTTDTNELFIGSSTGNKKLFDLTQINEQLTYLTTQLNNNVGSSDVSNISKGIEVLSADPTGNDLWEGRIWIVSSNVQQPPPDITAPIITSSSNGGSFTSAQSVTLSSNEPATIYYTLDGSTPTTSSTVYSSALTISSSSTLKFFGKDVSGNQSTVQSVNFTISIPDTTPPIVTINPSGGTYSSIQSVTLTANENSTIYYTLNGTTPTTSSTVYNSPISVSSTTTINYFAKDTAGNQSAVQTVTYTINLSDTTAPYPVGSLTAGTPTSNSIPIGWTLSTSNDVANYEVAYSTDGGSSYTISSNLINASSTSYTVTGLTANTIYNVRIVAIDGSGNRSTPTTVNVTTANLIVAPSLTTNGLLYDEPFTDLGNWVTPITSTSYSKTLVSGAMEIYPGLGNAYPAVLSNVPVRDDAYVVMTANMKAGDAGQDAYIIPAIRVVNSSTEWLAGKSRGGGAWGNNDYLSNDTNTGTNEGALSVQSAPSRGLTDTRTVFLLAKGTNGKMKASDNTNISSSSVAKAGGNYTGQIGFIMYSTDVTHVLRVQKYIAMTDSILQVTGQTSGQYGEMLVNGTVVATATSDINGKLNFDLFSLDIPKGGLSTVIINVYTDNTKTTKVKQSTTMNSVYAGSVYNL